LIKEKIPTTVDIIKKRLRKVMDPLSGLDVVRTQIVKDISVNNGSVHIAIDLSSDHQFAAAIRNEIKEKIEPLWDVKKVEVEFLD